MQIDEIIRRVKAEAGKSSAAPPHEHPGGEAAERGPALDSGTATTSGNSSPSTAPLWSTRSTAACSAGSRIPWRKPIGKNWPKGC